MPLITKGGIDSVDNRFVEVGVGIDDNGVLAAHLTNDALEFALTFSRLSSALPNPQTDFARPSERNKIDILVIDQMRAHHRTFAGQIIQNSR